MKRKPPSGRSEAEKMVLGLRARGPEMLREHEREVERSMSEFALKRLGGIISDEQAEETARADSLHIIFGAFNKGADITAIIPQISGLLSNDSEMLCGEACALLMRYYLQSGRFAKLLSLGSHENESVRRAAVWEANRHVLENGYKGRLSPLFAMALRDPDPEIRDFAREGLLAGARSGDEWAARALLPVKSGRKLDS